MRGKSHIFALIECGSMSTFSVTIIERLPNQTTQPGTPASWRRRCCLPLERVAAAAGPGGNRRKRLEAVACKARREGGNGRYFWPRYPISEHFGLTPPFIDRTPNEADRVTKQIFLTSRSAVFFTKLFCLSVLLFRCCCCCCFSPQIDDVYIETDLADLQSARVIS